MRVVRTVADLRRTLEPDEPGRVVGLVPTMGAYHEGHLSLFRAARAECGLVVASLFVNPAQFGPGDDPEAYPRNEAADLERAAAAAVDVLFAPSVDELYPPGFQTWVEVEELSRPLEGEHRPGHFRGVTTVCLKLFNLVHPQLAYFGLKDAQQAAVVLQLVRDLNLELRVRLLPTVRDADGLALSSRNVFLSQQERTLALALPRALAAGAAADREGSDPVAAARAALNGLAPDYLATLDVDGRRVLAGAVRIGKTRLIDNVLLEGDLA